MTYPSKPASLPIVVGSAITATAALVVAGTVDGTAVRVIAALIGVAAAVAALRIVSNSSRTAGLVGTAAIPLAVLVIGAPVAGVIDADSPAPAASGPGETTDRAPVEVAESADLDAQLAEALTQADRMVPNGSSSILELRFGWARSVAVLDQRTGDKVSVGRSGDKWGSVSTTRATQRNPFSRADLAKLSLNEAVPKVAAAAKQIGDSNTITDQTTVEIERRDEDRLLVVSFDSDRPPRKVQVDAEGELPDTLDAGAVDTVMVAAARIMRSAGVGPRTALTGFDFKSVIDEATIPAASGIQSLGGFVLDFDEGPVQSIVVVPGEFPRIKKREGRSYPTSPRFRLSNLSQASVIRARDDLMRRSNSPDYDKELVGFQAARVPGDHLSDAAARIRMSVGPVNANVEGIYELNGTFVRKGSW